MTSEQRKLTVEDEIMNSDMSESLQKHNLNFIDFLRSNGFSIKPEEDGNGWQIFYKNERIGHMNFVREFSGHDSAIWIDTCDFGDYADDALKETVWNHVRFCEHFSSGGTQCGCGRQPGFDRLIFGKEHKNLCFAHLGFMAPDAETLENIQRLMVLYRRNKSEM